MGSAQFWAPCILPLPQLPTRREEQPSEAEGGERSFAPLPPSSASSRCFRRGGGDEGARTRGVPVSRRVISMYLTPHTTVFQSLSKKRVSHKFPEKADPTCATPLPSSLPPPPPTSGTRDGEDDTPRGRGRVGGRGRACVRGRGGGVTWARKTAFGGVDQNSPSLSLSTPPSSSLPSSSVLSIM